MQKVRYIFITAFKVCNFKFFSLPSKGFFSPFPHGTRSLSVKNKFLALEGGTPFFKQNFTCFVLLIFTQITF